MKKIGYLLFLTLLCSCNVTENVSSSQSSSSQSVQMESRYGEEFAEKIVGNLSVDIPYMEADHYDCVVTQDDFGDPLVCMYLMYDDTSLNLEEKLAEYSNICYNEGYTCEFTTNREHQSDGYIEYNIYYADKELDDVKAIELQFLVGGRNGKDCIGIFAFNYIIVKPNMWPTNLVADVIGHDVPHLPEDNYTYAAQLEMDNGVKYVFISMKGTSYDEEVAYKDLLVQEGFSIVDTEYDEYGYFAYAPNNEYVIQFKFDDQSYFDLEIFIWKL